MLRNPTFKLDNSWSGQYSKSFRYLIMGHAWHAPDGIAHPLFLEFIVDTRTRGSVPGAKPGFTMVSLAGLQVQPKLPFLKVLGSITYPKHSIVWSGLRLPQVKATAKEYKRLDCIEVTYDSLRELSGSAAQGFGLTFEFGGSTRNKNGGKKLCFFAESNLDPPDDLQGKAVKLPFVARESFDELQECGSEQWH